MIHRRGLKKLREARIQESMSSGTDMAGYRAGSLKFLREFHETLGVSIDGRGRAYIPTDERGLPHRPSAVARPEEVSLRGLAESILGHEFVEEYYHPSGGFDFGNRSLMEAAIDPTAFIDINVFNLGVSGLVNAKIMERFNAPEYIGTSLVTMVPTNMNGHKRIGVSKIIPTSKASKGRQPGEQHVEVGFGEMYQVTPETIELAEKVKLTREAVYFDITGQVTESAGEIGDDLKYQQEKDIADTVLGVTGLTSRYNFNGTTYETYQVSSPYQNDLPGNQFQDITSVDRARQMFVGMTDPVTGREIQVNSYEILCMPFQEGRFQSQLFGPNIQVGTQMSAGGYPTFRTDAPNWLNKVGRGTYKLTALTAIWRNRALAADGLGLNGNIADMYWWVGDYQRAFEWHENWPLTPWQAPADELVMKDQGLVAVYGANYRGIPFSKEPRYVTRQKP